MEKLNPDTLKATAQKIEMIETHTHTHKKKTEC